MKDKLPGIFEPVQPGVGARGGTERAVLQSKRPMWRLAHWAYKDSSDLLILDKGVHRATIPSAEGVKQGDTFGSPLFALSIQKNYVNCSDKDDKVDKALS